VPGDRLWVREAWSKADPCLLGGRPQPVIFYRANNNRPLWAEARWRSPYHMFRRDSRITLELTDVRVQRLQEISEEDAIAEGVIGTEHDLATCADGSTDSHFEQVLMLSPREAYAALWDSINGKRAPWASNPWVWALTFRGIA